MVLNSDCVELDPQEIARRLDEEKSEVEKLGFALGLLVSDKAEIDMMVHRINSWIGDAVICLNKFPK